MVAHDGAGPVDQAAAVAGEQPRPRATWRSPHGSTRFGRPVAPARLSGGIVEDEPECVTAARSHGAEPVPHGRGREAPPRANRSVTRGEDDGVATRYRHRGCARLRTWPLLHDDELAARVVVAGTVEPDDDLEWEDEVAVEIAVQCVPVAGVVAEEQRGWSFIVMAGRAILCCKGTGSSRLTP